jgi:hypothetical protein
MPATGRAGWVPYARWFLALRPRRQCRGLKRLALQMQISAAARARHLGCDWRVICPPSPATVLDHNDAACTRVNASSNCLSASSQLTRVDFWRIQRIALMPACAVHHHDNALIGLACPELMGKQLHAPSMEVRQYQAVELASTDIHRHRRRMCTGASALLGNVDGLA